ncbi:MAG: hypothetical protein WDA02_04125 [Saccharofermentanales bacterium]
MDINSGGLDKLIEEFESLRKRLSEFEETSKVSLAELFTSAFLRSQTSFDHPEEFFALLPNPNEADTKELDIFASMYSSFDTWEELLRASAVDYTKHRLLEDLFD